MAGPHSSLAAPQGLAFRAPLPRFTHPASFLAFRAFRFFFLALVLGASCVAQASGKQLLATRSARACVCPGAFDAGADYFPHKVSPQSAKGWNVSYHGSYKVLTDVESGRRTALYLCGTPAPLNASVAGGFDAAVEIPIRRAGVDSSTFFSLFEYLGQRTSMTYYASTADYIVDACLQSMFAQNLINDTADAALADKAGVDVMFVTKTECFGIVGADYGKGCYDDPNPFANLPSAAVPFVRVLSDFEADPLAVVEWTEMISLFFNREEAANSVTEIVRARYQCHAAPFANLTVAQRPTLAFLTFFVSDPVKDCTAANVKGMMLFNASGKELVVARDAGAQVISFPAGKTFGDLPALLLNASALVFLNDWTNTGYVPTACKQVLLGLINGTSAYKKGAFYDIFKTASAAGTTDWFEGKVAEPDTLLLDIISVVHPDALEGENYTRTYLRNLLNGDKTDLQTKNACTDVDAPLFTTWEKDVHCKAAGNGIPVAGLAQLSPDDVVCSSAPAPTTAKPSGAPASRAGLLLLAAVAAAAL
jgi:iron complex transport system substrate-binding protein